MILTLYAPAQGRHPTIAAGSAIIGYVRDGYVHCYFEGNLYGAENLRRYYERAIVAAGRMVDRAPTVAQMLVPEEHLKAVARYDTETRRINEILDEIALVSWAGETAEMIVGQRLPVGAIDRNDPAVKAALADLVPESRDRWRTLSGQILALTPRGSLEIAG